LTISCLRKIFTSTKDIECNPITKKVIKTEENARTVDIITLRAQSLRGQGSISCQYFKLKRTRKKLKKNLINLIKCYRDQQLAQVQNEEKKNESKGYFSTAISWVKSAANQVGLAKSNSTDMTDISKLFIQLIESYLEIGYSKVRKIKFLYFFWFLLSDLYTVVLSLSKRERTVNVILQTFQTVHHVRSCKRSRTVNGCYAERSSCNPLQRIVENVYVTVKVRSRSRFKNEITIVKLLNIKRRK
jgi:hypothetical protein